MTIPPAKDSSYTIQQSTRQTRRRWLVLALTLISCFFLLASCVTWYVWKVVGKQYGPIWPDDESVRRAGEFTAVIAGLDEVDNVHRTDSIVVAHVNVREKTIGIVFVPRDMRVEIPGHGFEKINAAYSHGETPLLIETLEDFLGVEIKYYAVLRLPAFVKVIDAIGGVDVDVEKDMHYTDRAQKLFIDLKKGPQRLNGQKAMHYARFRHDWRGDFGRIERQQKIIKALTAKFFSFDIMKNLPALLGALQKDQLVITNVSLTDVAFLINFANDDETRKNMKMYTLPGEGRTIRGVSYVIPFYNEIPYIVAGMLKGGYHPDNKLVKIEISNGCGSSGIANQYAQRLTYFGFDVLEVTNADNFDFDKTAIVVYRKTPFDSKLAQMLGADLHQEPSPDSIPNMRIIIGKDKLREESGRDNT